MSKTINPDDYIKWGQIVFEKAKKIYLHELDHKTKVIQLIESLSTKYNLSDKAIDDQNLRAFYDLSFGAFMLKGTFPGPAEVKTYWLNYLVKNPYSIYQKNWEESIREIIQNRFPPYVIDEYREHDFYDLNIGGEFNLTYPGDSHQTLNICVPYTLYHYHIEFAINLIEKITRSKVSKISLWYFTHEISVTSLYSEISIAIDDNMNKHNGCPSISKEKFLQFEFSSFQDWYREIPDYEEYIETVNKSIETEE